MRYALSIDCVDGDTVYEVTSSDKKLVLNFLLKHDHEGSGVALVMVDKERGISRVNWNAEAIYKELGYEAHN